MNNRFIQAISKLTMGTSATASIIAEDGKVTLRKCVKYRRRKKRLNEQIEQSKIKWKQSLNSNLRNVHPVTSPLVLISQIQRSGGSLLSQLFDGHPEIHAHPHELMLGYKKKHIWPKIDLNENPERWFYILFENVITKHAKEGYKKQKDDKESFPFSFNIYLQNKIFLEHIHSIKSLTLRSVFDAYMTSYFGAWLNNQNYNDEKKFVTAFTPRLAMYEESIESFFEVYPEGRLISTVRNPRNWYPSALRHGPKKYGEIRNALEQWKDNTQAMIRNKERYGGRLCIIKFEDLVKSTQAVMRYLAEFLQIKFDDILLTPTFNKAPIKANTSFQADKLGIINGTLSRYKTLDPNELKTIEEMTKDDYQRVLKMAVTF